MSTVVSSMASGTAIVRFLKGRFSAAKCRLEPGVLAEVLSEKEVALYGNKAFDFAKIWYNPR